MFCKNGTDTTSMAMMATRAQTGKRFVLLAHGAYHGAAAWCTPFPAGVIAKDRAQLRYYEYNDVASLEAAVRETRVTISPQSSLPRSSMTRSPIRCCPIRTMHGVRASCAMKPARCW